MTRIFHGNFVYARSGKELVEEKDAYLVVRDGVIEGTYPVLPDEYAGAAVEDLGADVLIPAFSDLHVHAPQYPQRGVKTDVLLYDWLHRYTFPLEEKFADVSFAEDAYESFVEDMLAHGTMHAAVYGTIHRESTGILIEKLEKRGFLSYVGKVNMDVDSPDGLRETPASSISETERFLDAYGKNIYARPILTPRFAPTCSRELLVGLGKLAKKYAVGVQTHLVESKWEKEESVRRFPDCSCDTEIYEKTGLLGYGPLIGGHFMYPSDEDIRILKKYGGYAVQCPDATINVIAGIMPTAKLFDAGVDLAFGSDVAAGASVAVYQEVARSVQLSKIKALYEGVEPIAFSQAFFMATKGGGSLFGKVGSLEKGYRFDALVVKNNGDRFAPLTPTEVVERFCYAGEKADIVKKYMNGEEIK